MNEQNYTDKSYQYESSNGSLFDVEYTIRFNEVGGIQAVAKYAFFPSEQMEGLDDDVDNQLTKSGYVRYTGYDFPRCECECAVRNQIAEEIEKLIGGEVEYTSDDLLAEGDLGSSELFNDQYFEESYNAMLNYDEDDTYDEDGIEGCGIMSSRYYNPIKGEPEVLGIDRSGRLVVINGINIRNDNNKIDGANVIFAEPITDEMLDDAINYFLNDDDSDNLKYLANRYDFDIANADEDELIGIREDIADIVRSNIGEYEDQVYGYAGIEIGFDMEIEDALTNLANNDPNGYEEIKNYYKYYLKHGNSIDIEDDIWGWNILDSKKSLDLYYDSNFEIVVNKKLMNNVKAFSKPTEQNKRVEDGAIKDFEENGLSYEDRTKFFRQ